MTTTWNKITKASGTSWTKVTKPSNNSGGLSNGMPIGLLLSLTYTLAGSTAWTKITKASGTTWTKITKAT